MDELLAKLNDKQKQAVTSVNGPLLILAGAGSGKTTVLVNRIAYILETTNTSGYNILAITFTNKAAREMRERVSLLLGEDCAKDMWICTFHSACIKILHRHIDLLGYSSDFVIYDTQDSLHLIKDCMKDMNISEGNFKPKSVLSEISNAKNDMMDPVTYAGLYENDYRKSIIARIYDLYQKRLKTSNAMDFDDIIMNTIKLFSEHPQVLNIYQNRFKYILVDEYQDTNNSQYMLISLLSQKHKNLCVVGDDDQSIYKFRGANINNILNFEQEFENALTIKLEQNYRSTANILNAANSVISNNKGRKGKNLWTNQPDGEKITVLTCDNESAEALFICDRIEHLRSEGMDYKDCAVLYRTNAQSRVIEEMLIKNGIPYKILAGLRFYDRKEIKDIIAYLRVVNNPSDAISLKRIINEPKRGIGNTTLEKVETIANENGISMFEVIKNASQYDDISRAAVKLLLFAEFITEMQKYTSGNSIVILTDKILHESGYLTALEAENTADAKSRIDNLNEFLSVAGEYEKNAEEPSLSEFLENLSLMSDIDSYDDEQNVVVLMTIHSAKGLEFPVVFLTGMEEGLFPSMRSIEPEDIEEERRLCYVAITRAKKRLYITNASFRNSFGTSSYTIPSRFLDEIDTAYIDNITKTFAKAKNKIKQISFDNTAKTAGGFTGEVSSFISKMKSAAAMPKLDYKKGDVVEHKKFGRGVIISAMPIGNDMKLEVEFEQAGKKNLMAIFANMKKIN